jgi:hypothetical protein
MAQMMGYQQKMAESGKLIWAERTHPCRRLLPSR